MTNFDAEWDAGEMGCGEVLIQLRFKMAELESGQVFKLTTRDSGAPEEMPAWCRMTGHILVESLPPFFLIRKRKD